MSAGILNALDNLENAQVEYQYGRHKGIRLAIQALEYHHLRYMEVFWLDDYSWHHESTAYLNRLGQIFYYLRSMGMEPKFSSMPSFSNATKFRMKYSAHRQIDDPRKGDALADYAAPGITTVRPIRHFQAFDKRAKIDFYPCITIPAGIGDGRSNTSFCLPFDHPYIMGDIVRSISGLACAQSI
ncbi:hypothetical protein [Pseudomonas viridiflava]|uniref:hypothetical protein n=1 Tax=Pseudomonas viridiflava TaxID=33069 RepID=UPI000C086DBA|nr:hypothetical protein [Pseudomonas viridiflava]PHN61962.1 hypothetical protein AO275_20750 [Pseudomonas viridiflava]